jgi:beta-glucosidase
MRKQLGDRLPEFTAEEAALVRGSNDFYGMNHYCANYVKHKTTEPELDDHLGNLETLYQNKQGEWIGPETESFWLRPMPLGFRKLITWLSKRYGGPTFYVTENGTSLKGENDLPLEQLLDDEFRCEYFRGYVGALADAHTIDGVDVRGYSAWSLMEYVKFVPSVILTRRSTHALGEWFRVDVSGRCRSCIMFMLSCHVASERATPWTFLASNTHWDGDHR